jgi:hypothetical protein
MFKLTFGADLGFDNGIYDGGSHATVEEAIKVADDELATAHQVYGAFVRDCHGKVVAESNGTWGDQIPWWHCNLLATKD